MSRIRALFGTAILTTALVATQAQFASATGAPGDLDDSFGDGGFVVTDISSHATGVLVQPDGKIVVAGGALARFNPDGTFDASFGSGGVVPGFAARTIALRPDGKIVAEGSMEGAGYLARFMPDGTLDPSFGSGGLANSQGGSVALSLQADGKILVVAAWSTTDFTIMRYTSNGDPDASFGSGGTVVTDFGQQDEAFALALQSDGRFIVLGSTGKNSSSPFDFALARYLPDGTLDGSFGSGGLVVTDFAATTDHYDDDDGGRALALQPDGKIIAAGWASADDEQDFAVARYLPDGSLDPSFDGDGLVTVNVHNSEQGHEVLLQPDGRIVVVGFGDSGERFALARLEQDGSLDPSFGNGGVVIAPQIGEDTFAAAALQADGKIVAVGNSYESGQGRWAIARFLGDPASPATAPDPPTNVMASPGDSQATVSWTAPSSDGGSAITGYEVEVSPGGQVVPAGANDTQATITGLTNCTPYSFVVRARNAVGPSDDSDPASATPSSTAAVQVGESGSQYVYTPRNVIVPAQQCVRVRWTFNATNARAHTVTEAANGSAGLGPANAPLFNSGLIGPGGSFSSPLLQGATLYQYRSTAPGDSNSPSLYGTISMPVNVSPSTGPRTSSFVVRWAPAPMPGFSFSVQYQYRKANASKWPTTWTAWLSNQTGNQAAFVPPVKNGAGSYRFQARIRNTTTGKLGGWSWVSAAPTCPCEITVT
jgi:uncharacterized delta-60 repeat protein